MPGALDGIRVLDFTHALNGPFCTMLLGHLGAEIIKVEPPIGDNYRRSWMPPGSPEDAYGFLMVGTNKKGIVLNLKSERGKDIARRLIAVSDVLVENYQQGTMESFGLAYESVKTLNPRLIYACSRGYGETGPYASYGSNAGSNQAMTGWSERVRRPGGAPGMSDIGIGDQSGGVSLAAGILAALHVRNRTGEGQKIEVAMQEALLGFMVGAMHEHFTGTSICDEDPPPVAETSPSIAEVLEDPQVRGREVILEREHPGWGQITLVAPWIRMSKTPTSIRQVSPTLGEHTDEVLTGILGLTPSEIEALRAESAIA